MRDLGLREFRLINGKRCRAIFGETEQWSPNDWMTALAGEVGEAANLLKKLRRGEPVPPSSIADELADAFTYLDLLANRLGIDLCDAVREKFDKVSDRRGWEGPRLSAEDRP